MEEGVGLVHEERDSARGDRPEEDSLGREDGVERAGDDELQDFEKARLAGALLGARHDQVGRHVGSLDCVGVEDPEAAQHGGRLGHHDEAPDERDDGLEDFGLFGLDALGLEGVEGGRLGAEFHQELGGFQTFGVGARLDVERGGDLGALQAAPSIR